MIRTPMASTPIASTPMASMPIASTPIDSVERVHQTLLAQLQSDNPSAEPTIQPALSAPEAIEIFRSQCLTRALDRTSRTLQKDGQGFYTIGASGHEGLAAIAAALRTNDMAFLHYRDAAFQLQRAQMAGVETRVWDMLLSFACAKTDPISGGRHKVLGSKKLNIPPQTSTIASHLPKAVGAAFSLGLAKKHPPKHQVLSDGSIILCSFGDASLNHSTAQGAINTASWTAYQASPMPLLMVCADNGIGISVKTPQGWVAANLQSRVGIQYFFAHGHDLFDTYQVAQQAAHYVRTTRKPAFLHLQTVRLFGHAGADVAEAYLSREEIAQDEAHDPLLHSARLLQQAGYLTPAQSLQIYQQAIDTVTTLAEKIPQVPRLQSAADVMSSLVPKKRNLAPIPTFTEEQRIALFAEKDWATPQPMRRLINWALHEEMTRCPEIILMGEDIGRKGGVYGLTLRLQQQFGTGRVIDTLLDEQSILGLAIGLAHNGFLPIPEIQFLAYLHNAEDQLRGEAATLSFFSNQQFSNPMLLRIAGLGYQKGFGGHFHNDNSLAVLRDIPSVILACPSRGRKAVALLRECVRLVREEQRIVVFLEPIALYGTRDLLHDGDDLWADNYPNETHAAFGAVCVQNPTATTAIISYGNGYYLSAQADQERQNNGLPATRLIDLRWLSPLPEQSLIHALDGVGDIVIVDECRASGNIAEGLLRILPPDLRAKCRLICAQDSFIATGPAYGATMPSKDDILEVLDQASSPSMSAANAKG